MRKLLYILMLLSQWALGQNNKAIAGKEYYYLYGGRNFDEARSVKEVPGKGYIVAGTSSSFGQGNTSALLIGTDSLGKHVWSGTYGSTQNDWAYSVEVTADSGYFVTGYSNSFNPPNGYDGWYFRTDKKGNQLWQKTISGNDWDFLYGSAPLPDSGYILCGDSYTNSYGSADAWLMRINKNGDTLWSKHFGGTFDEKFNSVCIINNRIYATGTNQTHDADTLSDGWIVKFDMNGNFIGEAYFVGPPHTGEEFKGITQYDATTLFVCGKMDWVDSSATQSLVAKMDTSLNFIIGPYAGGLTSYGEYVCFNQVVNKSYGNIFIVGTATGGWGGYNMFLVGFTGNLIFINDFAHDCGLSDDEFGYSGIYTSSGRIIMVGSARMLCSANPGLGLEDAYLVRFDSDSVEDKKITQVITDCFADTLDYWAVSQHQYTNDLSFHLYPNPTDNVAHLSVASQNNNSFILHVYSVLGTEVMRQVVVPNGEQEIDVSRLQNGTYCLKLEDDHGLFLNATKLIINR